MDSSPRPVQRPTRTVPELRAGTALKPSREPFVDAPLSRVWSFASQLLKHHFDTKLEQFQRDPKALRGGLRATGFAFHFATNPSTVASSAAQTVSPTALNQQPSSTRSIVVQPARTFLIYGILEAAARRLSEYAFSPVVESTPATISGRLGRVVRAKRGKRSDDEPMEHILSKRSDERLRLQWQLFGEPLSSLTDRLAESPRLRRLPAILERRFSDPAFDLAVAARLCRLSGSHLNALLVRHCGLSFRRLLVRRRLRKRAASFGRRPGGFQTPSVDRRLGPPDAGPGERPLHRNGSSNRITTAGYLYDNAGRMTNEPGKSYQYDAEGKLTSVNSGALGSHGYDGDGRRMKKSAGGSTRYYFPDAAGAAVWEYKQGAQ